ncbi:MAG: hypothetical protein LUG16_03660 [Candidatus Gastranaerophilales bacterium]|nr:hypothetical protein [Candidatus Gastranaerophilales bacterium]
MANVLNSIVKNQTLDKPAVNDSTPFNRYETKDKIKPMEYKGKLLPSRIIGSPVEYAKDLKQDVVNIGRAARGKSNDHELGRINDLAMKLGSLALAGYLFVKNPLKLSKTMEFVGFGTFFGSMALWPKLAIQAPLKARTGVDIHQKYIDSQGRKKNVFLDPQYDLTDLYDQETLNKTGDKLGVSKDIADRNNFIKQRMKKTAVQGNTLWMMTAGFATPIMSALTCNLIEKPLNKLYEVLDLKSTEKALNKGSEGFVKSELNYLKNSKTQKAFSDFLTNNENELLDTKTIGKIAEKISGKVNSASFKNTIEQELSNLGKNNVELNVDFIRNNLSSVVPETVIDTLTNPQNEEFKTLLKEGSLDKISNMIASATGGKRREQQKLFNTVYTTLDNAKKQMEIPKVGDYKERIMLLYNDVAKFSSGKNRIDNFVRARVGDNSGSYIANQWNRVGNTIVNSLDLKNGELKSLADGNNNLLVNKLKQLAQNDDKFKATVGDLTNLINDYESKTGTQFLKTVKNESTFVCGAGEKLLNSDGFKKTAESISSAAKNGTLEDLINVHAKERASGAQSSFYRILQTLDVFKKDSTGQLESQIAELLVKNNAAEENIQTTAKSLAGKCKEIMLSATTTDYIEKLQGLTDTQYKTVMEVLFDKNLDSTIGEALNGKPGSEKLVEGLNRYKDEFMAKIANWENSITPQLSARVVDGGKKTSGLNAVERNNLVGKPFASLIQDVSKTKYNSRKWLMIWGGAMAALTAATLLIGLTFGRKNKSEKMAEEENKVNG